MFAFTVPAFAQFSRSPGAGIEDAARATAPNRREPSSSSEEKADSAPDSGVTIAGDYSNDLRIETYLKTILPLIRDRWYSEIDDSFPKPDRLRGEVVVAFTVHRSGKVTDIKVVSSSRKKDLDDVAVNAMLAIERLPRFPDSLPKDKIDMRMHFKYVPRKKSLPITLRSR
jgi:TonB family protein